MATFSYLGRLLPLTLALATAAEAASLRGGHFSHVVRDVKMAPAGHAAVRADANAPVADGSVQTGRESRAEVAFNDQTVLRLGDNTDVAMQTASRMFQIISGAVLTQVPPGVGATTVKVGSITATATGTTMTVEALPKAYTKFIVLDGTSRLCLKAGTMVSDCVLLRAGQMLIAGPDAKSLPEAVDINLARFLDTSHFITDFGALPNQQAVTKAAATQAKRKSTGNFADTNLIIHGRGTVVNMKKNEVGQPSPTGSRTASPSASPAARPTP